MDFTTQRLMMSASGAGSVVSYWIATLTGTNVDQGQALSLDSTGNIYITGTTASQGAGLGDLFTAKFDSNGTLQWQRILGGTAYEFGFANGVDSSSNVYSAGQTASQGSGGNDGLIVKYNSSGTVQWQRSLGSTSSESLFGLDVDSSSNVYVSGYTTSAVPDRCIIAKYNSAGTLQWQASLGVSSGATMDSYGVAVDASSNVYVTATQNTSFYLAKYNSTGTLQWQRSLGTLASGLYTRGVAIDSSANAYITGYTYENSGSTNNIFLAKYDTTGVLQWQRTLSGTAIDEAYSVATDGSNVYIGGKTTSQGGSVSNMIIAKYNSSGTIQWQRTISGNNDEAINGIQTDGTSVYVAGTTSSSSGIDDVFIAKLPVDGSLTGTYGSFTYAASTLTSATSTFTDSAGTATSATATLTDAARTLTGATSTLTAATTNL